MLTINLLLKRIMDIVLGLTALSCFAPFWFLIAILIKLDSPGPVFYVHTRVGRNGQEFNCFKFRTMKIGSDPNRLAESKDDDRITKLGHFLRRTSLDETPQLLNVLLGHMSMVGPRPALPVQVRNFSQEDLWKLKTKPGITGWTQVNGRNSIPYEKRMELDCWYARHHNIFLDIWIIIRTFAVLVFGDGLYDRNSTSPVE